MFYLVIVLFGVGWILVSIVRNYVASKSPISNKYLNHGTLIELIWTITPALILIFIAFPSFKLLYLMDEVTDPSLTVFVEGHQWYWSYQYPDFLNEEEEELEFDYDKYTHYSSGSTSNNNIPSLNSLDLTPEAPDPSTKGIKVSQLMAQRGEELLRNRALEINPGGFISSYYHSASLKELGIEKTSQEGRIVHQVCCKYVDNHSWNAQEVKTPLFKFCKAMVSNQGTCWVSKTVYSDSVHHRSIGKSVVGLLFLEGH